MFSGIVAGTGRVVSLVSGEPGIRLVVNAPGLLEGVLDGESVALNGVCLTAVAATADIVVGDDAIGFRRVDRHPGTGPGAGQP